MRYTMRFASSMRLLQFWPCLRKICKIFFLAAHAALLSSCSGGWSVQNGSGGEQQPAEKRIGNDKKRPHRHKSLYGHFGAGSQYKRTQKGICIPPARGISAANLLKRCLTASATPPGLYSHSHGFSPFCKSRSSKNDGRPVQSSRHFPCAMRCFSVSQGLGFIYLISGHFRILHKGHGDLLRHGALRQQLCHEDQPHPRVTQPVPSR